MIEHGISINQINILHGLGITLRELSDLNIDSLRISTCLKNKLKKLDLEKIYLEDNEKKRIDFSDVLEKEIRIILEPFEVISIINLRLKLL